MDTNRSILSMVTEQRAINPANNNEVVARKQMRYDEYDFETSGTLPTFASATWAGPVNGSYRGNVTSLRTYTSVAGNVYIETHSYFDKYGNLRKSVDANGNVSQTEYDASDYACAYPTKTISPVPGGYGSTTAFETTSTYDYNTGLRLSTTGENGLVVKMEYTDSLLRPTKVKPTYNNVTAGAETITEYGAGTSDSTRFVKVKTQIDETNWKEGYTWYDGLGRTVRTQSVDAANGDVFTLTCYDTMGRVKKVTNPFRNFTNQICSTTTGLEWTTTDYDDFGRVWKVKTPDNAEVETTHALATSGGAIGEAETTQDQAGKLKRSITDAFDNLVRVDEPNDVGQLGAIDNPHQPTIYSYDTLENLTQITQGGQARTFTYDSQNRLKTAANPESGTFQYSYDDNGNLIHKTDARNITTTFTYDALNRVNLRDYSDATPDVTYFYDEPNTAHSKGELTKVSSNVSTTEYTAFDAMGRTLAHKQTTDGQSYTTAYVYNLAGDLIQQTYPSGRVVKNVLDANGDLSIVQSKKNQNAGFWNYAQHFTYTTHDQISSVQFGSGRWESTQFNSRLQVKQIGLGGAKDTTDLLKIDYSYNTPNVADNNGNVKTQTLTVPAVGANQGFTAVQSYAYDSLNRLQSATETISGSQTWKQVFVYDRFGNKTYNEAETTTLPKICQENGQPAVCLNDRAIYNPSASTTNNQFSNYGYDAVGNTTGDAQGRTFVYDAENKQTEVRDAQNQIIGQYFYDGDGRRVKKISDTETTVFVYDAEGKPAAEYSTQSESNPQVSYTTTDTLGSPRIKTDRDGNVISRSDHLPFGEDLITSQRTQSLGYKPDSARRKFTTYKRDTETGLDYAESRYYSPRLGRFVSPDEFKGGPDELFDFADDASENPTFYAELENPQSLNKYQYTYNNPIRYNDPTGHCIPLCLAPAVPIGKVIVDVIVTVGAGSAIGVTAGAAYELLRNTPATTGDPSCPGCGSSERMGQSLMSRKTQPQQQKQSQPTSNQASSGMGGSAGGGRNKPSSNKPGKSRVNKASRDPNAKGAVTMLKRNQQGKITNYTTFDKQGRARKRFRGEGGPHGGVNPPIKYRRERGKGRNAPLKRTEPARKNETPQ